MALWSVAFLGSRPLASLLDGGIASLAGPRVATAVMALPEVCRCASAVSGKVGLRMTSLLALVRKDLP